jgi:hypothetical protein
VSGDAFTTRRLAGKAELLLGILGKERCLGGSGKIQLHVLISREPDYSSDGWIHIIAGLPGSLDLQRNSMLLLNSIPFPEKGVSALN